jgi:hypothetical protein
LSFREERAEAAVKRLSLLAKTLLALGALVGLFFYLLIVDLGVNAGRIHYGVSLSDVDLGGMTGQEAAGALNRRKSFLRHEEFCFQAPGFSSCATPAQLGWSPDVGAVVDEALQVGRQDAPFGALADRVRAWIDGVKVRWDTTPRAYRVTRLIDDWEQQLAREGHTVNRYKLRLRIRRAIVSYPRRPFRIPLES